MLARPAAAALQPRQAAPEGRAVAGPLARPAQLMPSEAELVAQFGVSRMTVNRALRELQAEGLVDRVQGVGTFAAQLHRVSSTLTIRDLHEEIEARGHRHHAEVHLAREERAPRGAGAAARPGRRRAGVPHADRAPRERRAAAMRGPLRQPGLRAGLPGRRLHAHDADALPARGGAAVGGAVLDRGERADARRRRGCSASARGEPCLVVVRRTVSRGVPITIGAAGAPGLALPARRQVPAMSGVQLDPRPTTCPRSRWRNGGGATRELLAWPTPQHWRCASASPRSSATARSRPSPASSAGSRCSKAPASSSHRRRGEHRLTPATRRCLRRRRSAALPLLDGPTRDLNLMLRGVPAARCARPSDWADLAAARASQCGLFAAVAGRCLRRRPRRRSCAPYACCGSTRAPAQLALRAPAQRPRRGWSDGGCTAPESRRHDDALAQRAPRHAGRRARRGAGRARRAARRRRHARAGSAPRPRCRADVAPSTPSTTSAARWSRRA